MKVILCFTLYIIQSLASGINFNNNACQQLYLYHIAAISSKCYENPDVFSNATSIAERHGYAVETHRVTTDDGYILSLFKISAKNQVKNYTIFIQHGIATNSAVWVYVNNRSLAFNLANQGYNVWLGNVRGSTYSRRHESLTVEDPKYWEFNLDVIVENDMKQQINYVYDKDGQKIHYIGHSMGTTLGAMLFSSRDDVINQIQSAIFLAPVVYLNNSYGITRPALALTKIFEKLNIKGLLYHENQIHKILTNLCEILPYVCFASIDLLFGKTTQFPSEDLILYFNKFPGGVSIYQLQQYLQIAIDSRFQKFNYGRKENLEKYGSEVPPAYNLTLMTTPICLLYGENDRLYAKPNLDRLFREIGSAEKCKYSISSPTGEKYNHVDFYHAKTVVQALQERLLEILKKFENL